MTSAALHEQHKARVLDSPRQHHDEDVDALIAEALREADHWLGFVYETSQPVRKKIAAALKALGK